MRKLSLEQSRILITSPSGSLNSFRRENPEPCIFQMRTLLSVPPLTKYCPYLVSVTHLTIAFLCASTDTGFPFVVEGTLQIVPSWLARYKYCWSGLRTISLIFLTK